MSGATPTSLQRRLLLYLLVCAPLVWALALAVSYNRARHEVNELFDTEMIRLARQVQATLVGLHSPDLPTDVAPPSAPPSAPPASGEADLRDLAIAVWDASGRVRLSDREGVALPRRPDASGFVDLDLASVPWRVYYLQSPRGEWLVAAGQQANERDELVQGLIASQLLPWLAVLPVLLVAMAWAVRQALAPVHALAGELARRSADDLQAVPEDQGPAELRPLLQSMNGLFGRIQATLARERRFTADAAHELRTPLAVLRAQWHLLRHAREPAEREQAAARLGAGLDRMDRLVAQLLALARLEATEQVARMQPVDWPAVVAQVVSDVLPLAERRRIQLGCDWPDDDQPALPLQGDADLLALLLRNLLDNAVRYAPEGSTVTLALLADQVQVANGGPALAPEALARLGERFHRPEGQAETGSGLGVSIAQRIAALHGLALQHQAGPGGQGVLAVLRRADTGPGLSA